MKFFIGALSVLALAVAVASTGTRGDAQNDAIVAAETATATITVDGASDAGAVNPLAWGVGAPDKYMDWSGNAALTQRIREAGIKLVRVGPVQAGLYRKKDLYPVSGTWDFSVSDAVLKAIFDGGAQPLFVVAGLPLGVPHELDAEKRITRADWSEYARFMAGVVRRYNVEWALGPQRRVVLWEMWNEPTIEGDGKFRSQGEYSQFVRSVGAAMKAQDPTIKLVGPADAWSDLGENGWLAYTAKNLGEEIDILSWHDYGGGPDQSDAARLARFKEHYRDNVATVKSGGTDGRFKAPKGKLFGAAITEYNMAWQAGDATYNRKFHNKYAATYAAAAIINALHADADLFCFYNLSETGDNHLGLLSNTDFAPRKPYYVFQMFGKRFGTRKLRASATGTTDDLEYIASSDAARKRYTIMVVNKNLTQTRKVTLKLRGIGAASGAVRVWKLNATRDPLKSEAARYAQSQFSSSLEPLSVTCFEVLP